jgi:predicted nucleotidyltransferase
MASIEKTLKSLANDYYISKDSTEKTKITASLNNIKAKLKQEFGNDIIVIVEFGSFVRKTNLPRLYDEKSDIDLMIVFNHDRLKWNPSTYRKHLLKFTDTYFPNSISYKSSPTVVLELNHIKYDLVPAHQRDEGWFTTSMVMYIPESDTEWMETDPHGFSKKLDSVNENYDYNVKRIIRLLKAWNAKVGYPLESYSLEKEIAKMNFSGDNIEEGFFYAIENLSTYRDSSSEERKIKALQDNAEKVQDALEDDNIKTAMRWLGHILPLA